MRKNFNIRMVLQTLIVLTLITCCVAPGILARYTTNASGSDEARVAKWSITDEKLSAHSPVTISGLSPSPYAYSGTPRTNPTEIVKVIQIKNESEVAVSLQISVTAMPTQLVMYLAEDEISDAAKACFRLELFEDSDGTIPLSMPITKTLAVGEDIELYARAVWLSDVVTDFTYKDENGSEINLTGDALDSYLGEKLTSVTWTLGWTAEQIN